MLLTSISSASTADLETSSALLIHMMPSFAEITPLSTKISCPQKRQRTAGRYTREHYAFCHLPSAAEA